MTNNFLKLKTECKTLSISCPSAVCWLSILITKTSRDVVTSDSIVRGTFLTNDYWRGYHRSTLNYIYYLYLIYIGELNRARYQWLKCEDSNYRLLPLHTCIMLYANRPNKSKGFSKVILHRIQTFLDVNNVCVAAKALRYIDNHKII